MFGKKKRARKDPVLGELKARLESLDANCLAGLERGLGAMTGGDLTVEAQPVTTPIESRSADPDVQALVDIFNSMLGRAQTSLDNYNTMREDLRAALGDHSVLADLRVKLNSLNGNCLTDLEAGVTAMQHGDLTVRVDPRTTPLQARDGERLGDLGEVFNSMLSRAQSSLVAYNAAREDLRAALGDHSVLDQLRERLASLNGNCLTNLQVGLEAMSRDGDLSIEVTPVTTPVTAEGEGSIGELGEIFNSMLGRAQTSLEAYNAMRSNLSEFADSVTLVADGDLSVEIHARGEKDTLGLAFGEMTVKLNELVGELAQMAAQLGDASQRMAQTSDEAGRAIGEIAQAVGEVAHGAERQVRTVESAQRMTEEMASATQSSSESADEATTAASTAREVAHAGAEAITQATEAMTSVRETSQAVSGVMGDLAQKSDQIGGIVDTITNIAEQTNLLALNAAIEAARAGDMGRGFAVVADEVRKLAEESQRAAASIGGLITEIQGETQRAITAVKTGAQATESGATTVEQARESFLRIGGTVDDMNDRVGQIAAAIKQIADASARMQADMGDVASVAEQSSASAQQVSASTQQTSASAQEIATSAAELAGRAATLEQLVGRFKLAEVNA